jgi:general secretion pathway protein D
MLLTLSALPPAAAQSGKSSGSAIAEDEAARRLQAQAQAEALLAEGDALAAKKDDCGAAEKYRQAALLLKPGARATAGLRSAAVKKFATTGVACAKQHASLGEYAKAREILNAILGDEMAPADKPAQTLLKNLDDPDRHNPSLTPAHTENVARVRKMLRQAEQLKEIGDFDAAKSMFNQVLEIDGTNTAARRGLEIVERHISEYMKSARDHTRLKMLNEVDRQWETPVPGLVTVKPLSAAGDELPIGGSSAAQKLRSIELPRLALTETPVPEALQYLSQQSANLDPSPEGVRGVNFIWSGNDSALKPVTLELRGVRLGDALRAICDMSGARYRVDGNVVNVYTGGSGSIETRQFKVPPGFLSTGASAAAVDAAAADPFATTPAADASKPRIGRMDAKTYFEQQGIPFPEGTRAAYSPGQNLLTVTNTADNLDNIAMIVDGLATGGQKQVQVQAILLRCSETTLRDIGGDFLLEAFNTGGNRVFAGGGTFGNSSITSVGSANASGVGTRSFSSVQVPFQPTTGPMTMGLRSSYDLDTALSIDQWIELSNSGGVQNIQPRAPYVGALAGAFTDPRFQALFRGLDQKKGVDLATASTVILKSGQKATSFSGRKFFYPSEFDPPQIPQSIQAPEFIDLNTGETFSTAFDTSAPVTPATPSSFQEKDIGASLEVEATVGEDGYTVDLNLSLSFSEFDGFINYGAPITDPEAPEVLLTDNRIIQPVFTRYSEATQVLVYDGATVAIGGLSQDKAETIEDKVPFFSSVPVIGRFFKSDVKRSTKSAVLYLVRVKIVDPGGGSVNAAGRTQEAAAQGVKLDAPADDMLLPE